MTDPVSISTGVILDRSSVLEEEKHSKLKCPDGHALRCVKTGHPHCNYVNLFTNLSECWKSLGRFAAIDDDK